MHIGFGIILDHKPHNFIREFQLNFHHQLSVLPDRQNPHITFKAPFKVHDIEEYVAYFDQLAKLMEPFEIELKGVGGFDKRILFLDVVENEKLTQLHNKVLNQMKDKFDVDPDPLEGENVKFHATMAAFPLEESFEEAKAMVEKKSPCFRFQAKEIGIFYHLGGDNSWIIYRKVPIGV